MSYSETKTKYNMEYAKKALKRIPLDVQKEKYTEIQFAAQKAGESVNGYIKKAIDEKMDRDNSTVHTATPEKPNRQQAASNE